MRNLGVLTTEKEETSSHCTESNSEEDTLLNAEGNLSLLGINTDLGLDVLNGDDLGLNSGNMNEDKKAKDFSLLDIDLDLGLL